MLGRRGLIISIEAVYYTLGKESLTNRLLEYLDIFTNADDHELKDEQELRERWGRNAAHLRLLPCLFI